MIELKSLAERYHESLDAIHMLNIQRIGLKTGFGENVVKLRVKFKHPQRGVLAKPIINNSESPYHLDGPEVLYLGLQTSIQVTQIEEDSPEPYYFRGRNVAVVNSTPFDPCTQGCKFCEQTTADPKKRRYAIKTSPQELFDRMMKDRRMSDLSSLEQISLITSCSGSEARAIELLRMYGNEARERKFRGHLLYATNEVRSEQGIQELADYGNVILAFTVECFTNRGLVMPGTKGSIELDEIRNILRNTRQKGVESSYFYIFGLDELENMRRGFAFLRNSITIAPTGPNYQPQGNVGVEIFARRPLEYFLKAREIYSDVHTGMPRFGANQNFRSLWPFECGDERKLVI